MPKLPLQARVIAGTLCLALLLTGRPAWACACGCGVFEVGSMQMLPMDQGLAIYFEYDFLDQNQNWSSTSAAPAADNPDKQLHTDFFTLGVQYLFNRTWGVMVQLPYWDRRFVTTADDGSIVSLHSGSIGDIRLEGIYAGFSDDMTTGITFGLKLPTGQWKAQGFDRDSQIGSGSVDLLLGIYHVGALTKGNLLSWFVRGKLDVPFAYQGGYIPGNEFDASLGAYVNGVISSTVKISPVFQVIGSYRMPDSGPAADSLNSGYVRVLLSPGVEVNVSNFSFYTDFEFPVYQNVNGNQLVASFLFKAVVAYFF